MNFTDGVLNLYIYSGEMGQMLHNYKRVVKGLGCVTIRGLLRLIICICVRNLMIRKPFVHL